MLDSNRESVRFGAITAAMNRRNDKQQEIKGRCFQIN